MANAAWLALAVMAHNLGRAVDLCAGPELARATATTRRHRVHHARPPYPHRPASTTATTRALAMGRPDPTGTGPHPRDPTALLTTDPRPDDQDPEKPADRQNRAAPSSTTPTPRPDHHRPDRAHDRQWTPASHREHRHRVLGPARVDPDRVGQVPHPGEDSSGGVLGDVLLGPGVVGTPPPGSSLWTRTPGGAAPFSRTPSPSSLPPPDAPTPHAGRAPQPRRPCTAVARTAALGCSSGGPLPNRERWGQER